MIASLSGIVTEHGKDHLVVETGGVGILVFVPTTIIAPPIGESIRLHTLLVVREQALTLYGFTTIDQREMFEIVLGVSGVGPRLALAMLSALSPDEIYQVVAQKNSARLAQVPGIGKKTAERLVLELGGKLKVQHTTSAAAPSAAAIALNRDLIDVLVSLGYSNNEAQSAVASLPPDASPDIEERLRLALRFFGGA